jgi:hypothetical protein
MRHVHQIYKVPMKEWARPSWVPRDMYPRVAPARLNGREATMLRDAMRLERWVAIMALILLLSLGELG